MTKCVGKEKIMIKFAHQFAVVAQMVEHQLPKLRVVGSIPIYRSGDIRAFGISGSLFFYDVPANVPADIIPCLSVGGSKQLERESDFEVYLERCALFPHDLYSS